MNGLLGKKLGMSHVFAEDGTVTPVTLIQAGPCYVTQIKTVATDGYNAIQVGFDETKIQRLSKGQQGHLGLLKADDRHAQRKADNGIPAVRALREFRVDNVSDYAVGQALTVELFDLGDRVDVTGTTKGRGFAGVVKRHGFGGGPKTHGQSDRWRAPGSIGSTSSVAHVFKGKRMPGHFGADRYTSQNLEVMRVDAARNLIAVKGAVPGAKGGLVTIRTSVKS